MILLVCFSVAAIVVVAAVVVAVAVVVVLVGVAVVVVVVVVLVLVVLVVLVVIVVVGGKKFHSDFRGRRGSAKTIARRCPGDAQGDAPGPSWEHPGPLPQ